MNEAKTAKFRFVGYKVTDTKIHIAPDVIKSGALCVHFNTNGKQSQESNKYHLSIVTDIKDEHSKIHIQVCVEADFEYDEIDSAMLDSFFASNAPAILFPYIRAYISAVTALSGVAPITIPTINFGKVSKMEKE